jgi:hypothetical protein
MIRFHSTKAHAVLRGVARRDHVCAPPGVTGESWDIGG